MPSKKRPPGSLIGDLAIRFRKHQNYKKILKQGFESSWYSQGDLRLHYYSYNQPAKPKVLLLHGYLDSAQTFRFLYKPIAQHHSFVALDLPGFGRSKLPDIKPLWQLPVFTQILIDFIEATGPYDSVIGHSMGGNLAVHLQLHHHFERPPFKQMHLITPGLLKHPEREKVRRKMFPENREDVREMIEAMFAGDAPPLSGFVLDGILRYAGKLGYRYFAENATENEDDVFFSAKQLRSISEPVFLYWGDADQITPIEFAKEIARAVPRTKIEIFPNTGHAIQQERRLELSQILCDNLLHPERAQRGRSGKGPQQTKGKSKTKVKTKTKTKNKSKTVSKSKAKGQRPRRSFAP